MTFRIIIPSRYAATRLPGKPLLDIDGKSMLQRVYEQACKTEAASIVIATEDARIETAARKLGAEVCLTRADHPSGTDRIAEVTQLLNYADDEIVVNVQGDQPFISPEIINQVAQNLARWSSVSMTTLCERIQDPAKLTNPSVAKVVMDAQGFALYFSRSLIPWSAIPNVALQAYYQHIGLYAYRTDFIQQFVTWPVSPLEELESLEQLRALWQGHKIHVEVAVKNSPPEVNTPADIIQAIHYAQNLADLPSL